MEFTHGLAETNMLENGMMIISMDKELSHTLLETNTLVNLKMALTTDKELTHMQMEQLRKVSGKTIN